MYLRVSVASNMLHLLDKYRPETKQAKKARLVERAEKRAKGAEDAPTKRPPVLKFGINQVTSLVEQKKALMVLIAHDVDPIEVLPSALAQTAPIPHNPHSLTRSPAAHSS